LYSMTTAIKSGSTPCGGEHRIFDVAPAYLG
jgi:hypothetical protein